MANDLRSLLPRDGELVVCSRCPYAMHATLVRHPDGTYSAAFYCERCDRGATARGN